MALQWFIAKAICRCATPNAGHPKPHAHWTNTMDAWSVVVVDELHAGVAASADGAVQADGPVHWR